MRLGDLDALKEEVKKYLEKRQDVLVWESDIYNIIDNAPTVSENGLIAEDYIKEKMFFVKRECDVQSIPVIAVKDLVAFERPRGKWVYTNKEDKEKGYGGYCSVCKCDMPIGVNDWKQEYYESNFCPNCGAKMVSSDKTREV